MLMLVADGSVLLERRPPAGIWGGLWGFPELAADADVAAWCRQRFGAAPRSMKTHAALRHTRQPKRRKGIRPTVRYRTMTRNFFD